jgi:hypothetical protein
MVDEQENEQEVAAELAKPEDITGYVEEREQEAADALPPEDEADAAIRAHPATQQAKKASRYERLKRARDQYRQESEEKDRRIAELEGAQSDDFDSDDLAPEEVLARAQGDGTGDAPSADHSLQRAHKVHGKAYEDAYNTLIDYLTRTKDQAAYQRIARSPDVGEELMRWHEEYLQNPAYEAEAEQGGEQLSQELQHGLQAVEAQAHNEYLARRQGELNVRCQAFAAQVPDFFETCQSVEGVHNIPPVMADLIQSSPVGPQIAYHLAKDFWSENSQGLLDHCETLANDPIAQARLVGAWEHAVQSGGPSRPRPTQAPPPLAPVRGGASAPRDLHTLASKGDDAGDYIRARRGA